MKRYKYLGAHVLGDWMNVLRVLNINGQHGWELVSCQPDGGGHMLLLKRELDDEEETPDTATSPFAAEH